MEAGRCKTPDPGSRPDPDRITQYPGGDTMKRLAAIGTALMLDRRVRQRQPDDPDEQHRPHRVHGAAQRRATKCRRSPTPTRMRAEPPRSRSTCRATRNGRSQRRRHGQLLGAGVRLSRPARPSTWRTSTPARPASRAPCSSTRNLSPASPCSWTATATAP